MQFERRIPEITLTKYFQEDTAQSDSAAVESSCMISRRMWFVFNVLCPDFALAAIAIVASSFFPGKFLGHLTGRGQPCDSAASIKIIIKIEALGNATRDAMVGARLDRLVEDSCSLAHWLAGSS